MDLSLSQLANAVGAEATTMRVAVIAPRLLAAVVIGVVLSSRPWRVVMRRPPPRREMVQAQIMLCAAAAVVTMVIGDSLAKAFGLVGLGSFVRFRSGLKDPRDAAILFLVIGLGMACGHGSLALAVSGALFVAALLAALDLFNGATPDAEEPRADAAAPAPSAKEAS
jgi:hypothetical protein